MARHRHNESGQRKGPFTIKVGRDYVTFYQVYCSCGAYVRNIITGTQSEN